MNNPLNFSNSELLSAYLDGEISAQNEKLLFEKLAQSDELRSEMRDLLAIRQEIETGATYYPPAALKTATMAKVGLDGVGAVGVFKSALPLMQKALMPVASALVGSLVTVMFFMNYVPNSDSFKNGTVAENPFKKETTESELFKSDNPTTVILSESEESTTEGLHKKMDSRLRGNNKVYFGNRDFMTQKEGSRTSRNDNSINQSLKNPEVLKTASTEENSVKSLVIIPIPEASLLKENISQNSLKSNDARTALKEVVQTLEDRFTDDGILPENASWLENMQFEIRGFSLANYPTPRTLPQSDPIFKNMAIGAYYTLNDEHAIGAEFGQEAFSQLFSSEETGNTGQYLMLPWGGLSYRYTPDISFTNIRPLAGMTLAGTSGGPVGRVILGMKLFPENSVSMMIAGEGALFAFPFQNKIFTSPKLGIMYGVAVKF